MQCHAVPLLSTAGSAGAGVCEQHCAGDTAVVSQLCALQSLGLYEPGAACPGFTPRFRAGNLI